MTTRDRSKLQIVLVALVALVACAGPSPVVTPTDRSNAPTRAPAATSVPSPASPAPSRSPSPPATPVPTAVPSTPGTEPGAHPTAAQLIGQKLVVTMAGHQPSTSLLARIRRGEIGGICLLPRNITTRAALITLTGKLQAAAAAGHQPRLLIAVDQEGGSLKRIPWAPPTLTVPQMGQMDSTSVARSQGAKTGKALLSAGVNVDFAPVADIPRTTASFMYQQGRTFGFNAARTARLADAFAAGLASEGVLATMKHFPGIGLATQNTDHFVDVITASKTTLETDLKPYAKAIGNNIPMIMLSNAAYTAYDPAHAAGWSPAVVNTLLRDDLGFNGVTITDSLNGTAHARGLTVKDLSLRAAIAGTDLILVTSGEDSSAHLYNYLLGEATDGTIPRTTLRDSYDRILAMKAGL